MRVNKATSSSLPFPANLSSADGASWASCSASASSAVSPSSSSPASCAASAASSSAKSTCTSDAAASSSVSVTTASAAGLIRARFARAVSSAGAASAAVSAAGASATTSAAGTSAAGISAGAPSGHCGTSAAGDLGKEASQQDFSQPFRRRSLRPALRFPRRRTLGFARSRLGCGGLGFRTSGVTSKLRSAHLQQHR